jgi:hypothetical protein
VDLIAHTRRVRNLMAMLLLATLAGSGVVQSTAPSAAAQAPPAAASGPRPRSSDGPTYTRATVAERFSRSMLASSRESTIHPAAVSVPASV